MARRKSKKRKKAIATDRPKPSLGFVPFLRGALVILLFFILLFGSAFATFHFDLFGAREIVIDWLDITDESSQLKERRLTEWETSLSNEAQVLADEQKKTQQKQREMTEQEAAVKQKESELERKITEYETLLAQLQPKNNDISTVAKVVGSMDAGAAASMFFELRDRQVRLNLLSSLKPATIAAILEKLDAQTAASFVEELTRAAARE